MGVNKVMFGDTPVMDISDSTVTPETLAAGSTAYGRNGEKITGTMPIYTVQYVPQDLTEQQQTQARENIGAISKGELLNGLEVWNGGSY